MEGQREDPQPFGGEIGDARPHGADFRRGVAEQRTEQQHFEDHTAYDSGVAHGRVEAVRLDPVQGTLLTTRSGDGEGHGRFRPPAGDAPDDPADEDNRGQQRQRHTQQRLESGDRPDQAMAPMSRTATSETIIPYLTPGLKFDISKSVTTIKRIPKGKQETGPIPRPDFPPGHVWPPSA